MPTKPGRFFPGEVGMRPNGWLRPGRANRAAPESAAGQTLRPEAPSRPGRSLLTTVPATITRGFQLTTSLVANQARRSHAKYSCLPHGRPFGG